MFPPAVRNTLAQNKAHTGNPFTAPTAKAPGQEKRELKKYPESGQIDTKSGSSLADKKVQTVTVYPLSETQITEKLKSLGVECTAAYTRTFESYCYQVNGHYILPHVESWNDKLVHMFEQDSKDAKEAGKEEHSLAHTLRDRDYFKNPDNIREAGTKAHKDNWTIQKQIESGNFHKTGSITYDVFDKDGNIVGRAGIQPGYFKKDGQEYFMAEGFIYLSYSTRKDRNIGSTLAITLSTINTKIFDEIAPDKHLLGLRLQDNPGPIAILKKFNFKAIAEDKTVMTHRPKPMEYLAYTRGKGPLNLEDYKVTES